MKQRGIVIAPYLKLSAGEVTEVNFSDATHLRKCALYWDLIDLPHSVLDGKMESADLNILRQEGILQQTRGQFFVKKGDHWILTWGVFEYPQEYWETMQLYALYRHRGGEENWTLGQINTPFSQRNISPSQFAFVDTGLGKVIKVTKETSSISPDYMTVGMSIDLELAKALPVPSSNVPMELVLAFKQKRQAELLQFHHAWDGLLLEVLGAADLVRAIEHKKDKLELALISLHRLMDESKMKKVIPTFTASISIDVGNMAASAIVGAAAAQGVGLNALVGVIGGAVFSAIKPNLNLSSRKPKDIPSDLKDYAYLYHVEKDLNR